MSIHVSYFFHVWLSFLGCSDFVCWYMEGAAVSRDIACACVCVRALLPDLNIYCDANESHREPFGWMWQNDITLLTHRATS